MKITHPTSHAEVEGFEICGVQLPLYTASGRAGGLSNMAISDDLGKRIYESVDGTKMRPWSPGENHLTWYVDFQKVIHINLHCCGNHTMSFNASL